MKDLIKYLCIDDETNSETEAYLELIQDQNSGLAIELRLPSEFSAEIENLKKEVKANDFKGFIFDLRLDGTKSSLARYRAPALVQEIHTRVAENSFPARPLALWSNDDKLNHSYWPDDTSHDLFDLTIYKERLVQRDKVYARNIAYKLTSLADGYKLIAGYRGEAKPRAMKLLKINDKMTNQLDPRLLQPLTLSLKETSIYEQARFIHRQLLSTPNTALVNAEILAARLGIELGSVLDFEGLVDLLFPDSRYKGVFSEGWACWWMPVIEESWLKLSKCAGPLQELTAEERVACINANTDRTALEPAQPLEQASSSSFWTICQITRRPLDPMDGYVVDRQLQPWQLTQYVSMHGKLAGGKIAERIKIDALDLERYNEDKNILRGI